MALLKKLYSGLRLQVNEAKSAVGSALGRKFLGYELWSAKGRDVKYAVGRKAQQDFKARIRQLTRRSGGRSLEQVIERLRAYVLGWAGKPTSVRRKRRRSGVSWTSGCGIGCEPSSCTTGGALPRSTEPSEHWVAVRTWRNEWRVTPAAGGAIATACSRWC